MTCPTCEGVGWLCSGTNKPADFERGTCCRPWESEEFALGRTCPSADGCPEGCAVGVSLGSRLRTDPSSSAVSPQPGTEGVST